MGRLSNTEHRCINSFCLVSVEPGLPATTKLETGVVILDYLLQQAGFAVPADQVGTNVKSFAVVLRGKSSAAGAADNVRIIARSPLAFDWLYGGGSRSDGGKP